MLNTQPYGGGLWHTWFDRDLGLAGRVICKNSDDQISSHLVRVDRPIARIPNLAIHLTAGSERDSFVPNLQEHAKAILTAVPSLINMPSFHADQEKRLHPCLVSLAAESAGIDPSSILDMELQLIDIQPPAFGGAANEFVLSGRLDNLCSSYQGMQALIDTSTTELLSTQPNITMVMLFDHEEVGSGSCQGAGSSLFMDTIRLILSKLTDGSHNTLSATLRKSFIISADMAHGLHPNYQSKHDPALAPKLTGGLVVKQNANQRYATTTVSAVMFREFAKIAKVPVQEFQVRSDMGCGR